MQDKFLFISKIILNLHSFLKTLKIVFCKEFKKLTYTVYK